MKFAFDTDEVLRDTLSKMIATYEKFFIEDYVAEEGEEEFEYKNPNPMLLSLVLNRIEPPLKSVTPTYKFDFDPEADLHKQAKQVLDAMAKGDIPSDVGQLFITSISSMLNIQEKTDFEERLKAIEDASEQD